MIRNGSPVSEVARSSGIGENIIFRWKSRSQGQPVTVAKENSQVTGDDNQLSLIKRIRELEMERDILKKALGIFSRQL